MLIAGAAPRASSSVTGSRSTALAPSWSARTRPLGVGQEGAAGIGQGHARAGRARNSGLPISVSRARSRAVSAGCVMNSASAARLRFAAARDLEEALDLCQLHSRASSSDLAASMPDQPAHAQP